MQQLSSGLDELNRLSAGDALEKLLYCCGSLIWAHKMVAARPFGSVPEFQSAADVAWSEASFEDKLEAFDEHPRIGNRAIGNKTQHQQWSSAEQKSVETASADLLSRLRDKNLEYEDKFGFTFIICATGKSTEEMYAALESRLSNGIEEEVSIAAEEQRQIMQLRLVKLLKEMA